MRRAQRLRQREEFAAVYRRGKPFRTNLFIMRALRTDEPLSRFGFTASRVVGNAVVRNRVRRRMREAARSLPVAPGWDLVLNSRTSAARASYPQIRDQMEAVMRQAGVLGEPTT